MSAFPIFFYTRHVGYVCRHQIRLNTPKEREPIPGILFSEILFADDTLIFEEDIASLKKLLKEIKLKSTYYNMSLNYQKYINLTTNRKISTIKYQNGNTVPRRQQAVYLGTSLTDTVNHVAEIQNRIAMVNHGNSEYSIPLLNPNLCTDSKLLS